MKISKTKILSILSNKKWRNNKILQDTLKIIKDKNFKIKTFNDIHKLRSYNKTENIPDAFYHSNKFIIINSNNDFTEDYLALLMVHEVNHYLNLDYNNIRSKKNGNIGLKFFRLEVFAYVAEYMFLQNTTRITRNIFKKIKNECLNDYITYPPYRTYATVENEKKILSWNEGIYLL